MSYPNFSPRIKKSKYDEEPNDRSRAKLKDHGSSKEEKKPRDKSRTRTIFGRRRSVSAKT